MDRKKELYDLFMNVYMMEGFRRVEALAFDALDRDDHAAVAAAGAAHETLLEEVRTFVPLGRA